jgi:hypothetical protein
MLETIAAIVGTIGIVEILHFLNRTYIKPRQEARHIHAGYAFIEKGVISQRKGGVYPPTENESNLKEQFSYQALRAVGYLDFIDKKKDTIDLLIFSVNNENKRPIHDIGANVSIASSYYSAGVPIFYENCSWTQDVDIIHIKIDELYPEQSSVIIIPLNSPKMKFIFEDDSEDGRRFLADKKICYIDAWYGSISLKIGNVKVLKKTSGSKSIIRMD